MEPCKTRTIAADEETDDCSGQVVPTSIVVMVVVQNGEGITE